MYYNQNNYAHVPYPSNEKPDATVKSGGCGVCCISMIVEGITGNRFPPEQSAVYSMKIGARLSGGTNMPLLATSISGLHSLAYSATNEIAGLETHLTDGGMAIVNVGGDRNGYTGLFSDAGHYIVAAGIEDGQIIIYDPGYYKGKFSKAGRTGKVRISGNKIYVSPALLDKDASNRAPRYYLFGLEDSMATIIKQIAAEAGLSEQEAIQALGMVAKFANKIEEEWEKEGAEYLKTSGLLSRERDGREPVEFGELGLILKRFKDNLTK